MKQKLVSKKVFLILLLDIKVMLTMPLYKQ